MLEVRQFSSGDVDFSALEVRVLERWERERTFERSLEQRRGAPRFVFYDGPPFATGLPHYGHILTSFIKDVVPRYQTMRGFDVPRRWGWDCHGLPVEVEAEKELGLRSPAEIPARLGEFNATCKQLVLRYADEWERVMHRLGRWVDFAGAYRTMDGDYIESVMWGFKELHARGLVYERNNVVHYCTRCQTVLSNSEARLDDANRERDDLALTVRFETDAGALLAWTTTPWTLPANAALAVHPDLDYVRASGVWLAEAALARYPELRVEERRRGSELVGTRYRPVFPYFSGDHRVVAASFVTAGDGTGIVHLAPAFGEDDQTTCDALGITGAHPVRDDGTFDDRVVDFAGMHVLEANESIARHLAQRGLVFARETYRHDVAHCWRCDSPLVYRAMPSWFVRVTAFKPELVANNKKIRWVPSHIGDKRFAAWLDNARDWAVSRNRFWGAPVPVWRCTCGELTVVGSRAELEARAGVPVTDWHRPAIDAVELRCKCGGTQRRVPDVLDCWFESGSMPFAQAHYPFSGRSDFPGDFIVEYVSQTRGWFYTLHVLSTALFGEPPFRDAVCHGVILGEDGRKMSKRLGNYPDPMLLVAEHGSDALRVALLSSGVVSGGDAKFSASSVRDAVRRVHLPLWNALHLVTAYAASDGWSPEPPRAPGRLERALLAEVELLRDDVERAMVAYDFERAYGVVEAFVTTLSTWYLRLAKPALWRAGLDDAKREAYAALYTALADFAVIAAPFLPFLAEAVHEALGGSESVHLADWPSPRAERRDDALVAEMRALREVVRLARRVREQAGVKHRQPLRVAWVSRALAPDDVALLAGELNVKEVRTLADVDAVVRRELVLDYGRLGKRLRERVKAVGAAVKAGDVRELPDGRVEAAGEVLDADEVSRRYVARPGTAAAAAGDLVVALDLAVDAALAREALARELSRCVQDLRKRAKLAYGDPIRLSVVGDGDELDASLREHEAWLREQCIATSLVRAPLPGALATQLDLGGTSVEVAIDPRI
jgi:isoleucyl-tRNA synthetase